MPQVERSTLVSLIEDINEAYESYLARLPFKKADREMLVDGFKDGTRNGVYQTVAMLGFEIIDGEGA